MGYDCTCISISAEAVEGNLTSLTLRMLPSREVTVGLTLSLAVSYTFFWFLQNNNNNVADYIDIHMQDFLEDIVHVHNLCS